MATENEVSDFTFDDMIKINSELVDTLKNLKRKYKETREHQNNAEFKRGMLKDEKKLLEEELEKLQESFSNINSQLTLLSQEIETQKEKNDALVFEYHELKTKVKLIELDNRSLKTKLESITKNVSNFNKGRETLSKIIDSSQSISSRKELGYVNKTTAPPKKEIRRNVNPTTKQTKRNSYPKSIKVWVPKTNNSLIRKRYINTF